MTDDIIRPLHEVIAVSFKLVLGDAQLGYHCSTNDARPYFFPSSIRSLKLVSSD
jgi:hypothetical protein